jgi:hypothetical protein
VLAPHSEPWVSTKNPAALYTTAPGLASERTRPVLGRRIRWTGVNIVLPADHEAAVRKLAIVDWLFPLLLSVGQFLTSLLAANQLFASAL